MKLSCREAAGFVFGLIGLLSIELEVTLRRENPATRAESKVGRAMGAGHEPMTFSVVDFIFWIPLATITTSNIGFYVPPGALPPPPLTKGSPAAPL
jgi:hypothetical protein